MVVRDDTPATAYREVDRFDRGVGWIAHPDELMARASHALEADGDVVVVDPVDAPGVDDLLAEFGDVTGVVVLNDRHGRDADALARRHDATLYVPSFVDPAVSGPSVPFTDELADTGFELIDVVNVPGWREAALSDGETLVVADALGTAPYFTAGDERIGVHPMLRAFPPTVLADHTPDRILTGHGAGVHTDATDALRYALDHARTNAPRVWLNALKSLL